MSTKCILNKSTMTAIADAIRTKGSTSSSMLPSAMPAAIRAIQTGYSMYDDVWTPPKEWPNIRQILAADTHNFNYKCIALYDKTFGGTLKCDSGLFYVVSDGVTTQEYSSDQSSIPWSETKRYMWVMSMWNDNPFNGNHRVYAGGDFNIGPIWIVYSEGAEQTLNYSGYFYGCNNIVSIENLTGRMTENRIASIGGSCMRNLSNLKSSPNSPYNLADFYSTAFLVNNQDRGGIEVLNGSTVDAVDFYRGVNVDYKFRYLYNLKKFNIHLNGVTSAKGTFQYSSKLVSIVSMDLSECTNTSNMFQLCTSLQSLPVELNLAASTNTSYMFHGCNSLLSMPTELNLSASTNTSGMFQQCISLQSLPVELNLSASTNTLYMFRECISLRSLPTHLTAHRSIDFKWSTKVAKESVATFDANGVVNGGMIGNLNTCNTSSQTITLSNATKALFTTNEITAIGICLTNKNWGLVWAN